MENTYFNNMNSRLPFSGFQNHVGGSAYTSRPPAAFSHPPPPPGRLAEPQMRARPPIYNPVYSADQGLSNTFGQAPIAPHQLSGLPPTVPLVPAAQFQSSARSNVSGEFRPSSCYISTKVPSLPVNVNVPPPPPANVNIPPPPPINTNIPPPGFNPRIHPPPVFSPQCLPPVDATSKSAFASSSSFLSSVQEASSFTDQTRITGARQSTFTNLPPPVRGFNSCQRMPPHNLNESSGSSGQCRSVQQYVHNSLSSEGRISHLPSVHSSIARVCENSAVHGSVEKCSDKSSILLSNVDDNARTSVGERAVLSTTQDSLVSDSRRRRATTRNYITVSCNLLLVYYCYRFLCNLILLFEIFLVSFCYMPQNLFISVSNFS